MILSENKNATLNSNEDDDKMKDVDIQVTSSTVQNGYDVVIYNEDYTLGTIMQYLLYSAHYEGDKQMTYVGFKKFHPHDDVSII